jgi:hypothetical protein
VAPGIVLFSRGEIGGQRRYEGGQRLESMHLWPVGTGDAGVTCRFGKGIKGVKPQSVLVKLRGR